VKGGTSHRLFSTPQVVALAIVPVYTLVASYVKIVICRLVVPVTYVYSLHKTILCCPMWCAVDIHFAACTNLQSIGYDVEDGWCGGGGGGAISRFLELTNYPMAV
jgi:hypothetical protein